jgi:hypothetical protein
VLGLIPSSTGSNETAGGDPLLCALPPATNRKLKIALIVDGERVWNHHVYQLAEWTIATDCLDVSHLIIQERTAPSESWLEMLLRGEIRRAARTLLWKVINKFESIEARLDPDRPHDLGQLVGGKIRVTPIISRSGHVHRFSDHDLDRIRHEQFDLLIRCGHGILKGDILGSARLGILSFHHGDNRAIRGGTPGFWEVYLRHPKTGFIVQRLTEELDGGDVILRGYVPTQASQLLNRSVLFTKSYYHLRALLLQIGRTGQLPVAEPQTPFCGRLVVAPTVRQQTRYLFRRVASSIAARVRRVLAYEERWGISYSKSGWRSAVLWRGSQISIPRGHFLADPFVATRGQRSCVFAEDFVAATGKAHISAFELTEGGARPLGVAIEEDFHLSFPYLFSFGGTLYMCPESFDANEIRIYECTEFPLKWKRAAVAMRNVRAADTMIFEKDGLWWMLTSINRAGPRAYCAELYLFWASSPVSTDWQPHARNPILTDPERSRNGGLLEDQGEIVRVGQCQGFGCYGASAGLFRITRITPQEYEEEKICTITPDFMPGIQGAHTFHSDGIYTVWDFKKWGRMRAPRLPFPRIVTPPASLPPAMRHIGA